MLETNAGSDENLALLGVNGFGVLIGFASYNKKENNVYK